MRRRQIAWILILIVDVGYIAWGAGAAASPDHLLGPGGKAILPAGYEGYSGASWSELAGACPMMYGEGVDFGHACMRWFMKLTGGLPT